MASANPSAFDRITKEVIWRRDNGRCDRCGFRIMDAVHFHHRRPRRMGGSDNRRLGLPSNGLALHPACHDYIEKHRSNAAALGFLCSDMQEPVDVPVYRWNGWAYLNDDGTLLRYPGVPPTHDVPPNPYGRQADAPDHAPSDPRDVLDGPDEADLSE